MPNGRAAGRPSAAGGKHDHRLPRTVHLHVGGIYRLRDHRSGSSHLAHAADVGFQLRARHRAGRRDGGAGACPGRHRNHHRRGRGAAGRGQRGRWLCRHRTHAGNVQIQQTGFSAIHGEKIMALPTWMPTFVEAIYFIAAVLFIWGIKRMSSPRTARTGIVWAGAGMAAAIIVTFFLPGMHNLGWMIGAIVIGVVLSWIVGRRVPMTAMPQMVALFNGMGGGAAAAIGAVELIKFNAALKLVPDTSPIQPEAWADVAGRLGTTELVLAFVGVLIGAVSFTGSLIAFAKLQGWMDRRFVFPLQRWANLAIFAAALVCGALALAAGIEGHAFAWGLLVGFIVLSLVFGI